MSSMHTATAQEIRVAVPGCRRITECRICCEADFVPVCDLGMQPLANSLLTAAELQKKESTYPLSVVRCTGCGLMQLEYGIEPSVLFEQYQYIPSVSRDYMKHFETFAEETITREHLRKESLVIDIGNNDGSLLALFAEKGIPVLGIDPAENIAALSEAKQVPALVTYFTAQTAKDLHTSGIAPDLILAFNTLAHIPDLIDFCTGIRTLLRPDGQFIAQFPYLDDLLTHVEFDTVYHEHCSYFSLRPLEKLCKKTGLELFDAVRQPVHGGSLRISIGHPGVHPVHPRVTALRKEEENKGLADEILFDTFTEKTAGRIKELQLLVQTLKSTGKTIAGFGMPAKGTVLLNACGFDASVLDYIVDGTPQKQGKYSPGGHIPIFPEAHLLTNPPDYLLVLAWNFFEEIARKNAAFAERGGRFIVPMPEIRVI